MIRKFIQNNHLKYQQYLDTNLGSYLGYEIIYKRDENRDNLWISVGTSTNIVVRFLIGNAA